MNILFDTNVIIDALTAREPFGEQAALLFNAVEQTEIIGYISADSVTTIYYLIQKATDKTHAVQMIKLLLELFEVAPVTRAVLEDALSLGFKDFEDAVVNRSAIGINTDGIVTRNPKDFSGSETSIFTPNELLSVIRGIKNQ